MLEIDTLRTEHRACVPFHPVIPFSLSLHFICLPFLVACDIALKFLVALVYN